MAGPLKHTRREAFVQHLLKGETLERAHELAGFTPNKQNAHRLKSRPDVAARLAELQERVAEKAVLTAADIARQLDEDRDFAKERGQAAAAVSATLGKAKVLGLIRDRHEHSGVGGGPIEYRDLSEEEVEARIRAHEADAARDSPTQH